VWALVAAGAVALPAAAQGPAGADEEYRRALEEHRQALEQTRRAEAEAERSGRWLTYGTLALLAGLVLWYLAAARREAADRRRRDEQAARADRRHQELLARAEAQTARVIELLESIDRQLRERGPAEPGAAAGGG